MKPLPRLLWLRYLTALFILLIGTALILLSRSRIEIIQRFGGFFAPDGNLEILARIPEFWLRAGLLVSSAMIILFGIMWLAKPVLVNQTLKWFTGLLKSFFGLLLTDIKSFFRQAAGWPHHRADRWFLLGIILISLMVRISLLDRPMRHDESYTVLTWASGTLRYLLEDYHLPNNHIFHTVLVALSYNLIGSQPWAVRLPAFIAGMMLIPAGYGLARQWYGRVTALIAALIIGMAPIITEYATNARGYTLFMLFSLLIFWLTARLLRKNNRFEWGLFALFGALGFWTVPMMLYPFGAACVWIFLSLLFDRKTIVTYGSRIRLARYLAAAGFSTVVLTGFMYSPVLLNSGPAQLFNNPFVASLSADEFWPTLLTSRLPETYAELTTTLGIAGQVVLAAGFILSLVFYWNTGKYRVPGAAGVFLWAILMLVWRKPNAWARTWSYLFPMVFIWVAAGWYQLFSYFLKSNKAVAVRKWLVIGTTGIVLFGSLFIAVRYRLSVCPGLVCSPGDEEASVLYLMPKLEDSDLVLVESPSNVALWYYFSQYGISREHFRTDRPFERAYILVRPGEEQSIETVIGQNSYSTAWFEMDTLKLDHTERAIQIFQVDANLERVQFEYRLK